MARGTSLKKADITFGSCMVLTYPLADPVNFGLHFLDGDFLKTIFVFFSSTLRSGRLSKHSTIVYCILFYFIFNKKKKNLPILWFLRRTL